MGHVDIPENHQVPWPKRHDVCCPINTMEQGKGGCICGPLRLARADEHKRVMDFCCEDTEADIRKRLAKEVAEIYIPALDNYGAVSAAAWMRLAAANLVRGETPSK